MTHSQNNFKSGILYGQSLHSFNLRSPTILKHSTKRPIQAVKVYVPSCFSPPQSPTSSQVWSSSFSYNSQLNPQRRRESSKASQSGKLGLICCIRPYTQLLPAHDWVDPTYAGGVFFCANGALPERFNVQFSVRARNKVLTLHGLSRRSDYITALCTCFIQSL